MPSIEQLLKDINKKYKKEVVMKGIRHLTVKRIPFTSPRANWQCYGGIPRGRVVQFVGGEGSGKTTSALDIISNAQRVFKEEWIAEITTLEKELKNTKLNKTDKTAKTDRLNMLRARGPKAIVYFDIEGTLDLEWASKLNVDCDNLFVAQLQEHTAEQILDRALDFIKADNGQCGLLVIDSIAMLIPQQIYDESLEQKSYCGNAGVVTTFINKVVPSLGASDSTLLVINQIRDDLGNPYAEGRCPGGKALKHQSSMTIWFKKGAPLDERGAEQKKSFDAPQGNVVLMNLIKSKVCKPDRKISFYTLNYDYGIDAISDTLELGMQFGVVMGLGWYTFMNPITGEVLMDGDQQLKIQGRTAVLEKLRTDKHIYNFIREAVDSALDLLNRPASMQTEEVGVEQGAAAEDVVAEEEVYEDESDWVGELPLMGSPAALDEQEEE